MHLDFLQERRDGTMYVCMHVDSSRNNETVVRMHVYMYVCMYVCLHACI
jgi:hypothetical protein